MTVEYKDSKRITALSTDWTADVTSNITWSTTGKVGWDISGTTISKTGSNGWGATKIQSTDTFTVGDGAFMIEFSGTVPGSTMIGFNKGTLGYYIGSPQNQNDFSIYMAGGDLVEVYESGSKNYGSGGTRSNASDRFRIEVSNSGVVKYYYQAGGTGSFVLKYTSSITASGTYFIQANAWSSSSEATVHSKTLFDTAVAKPSDVQDNSLLVEKDTARRYWFSDPPTFQDDFNYASQSSADSAWVRSDTSTNTVRVNISDDDIDFNFTDNSTNSTIVYDLGAGNVSDTKWTLRFKAHLTSKSSNPHFLAGISDEAESSGDNNSQKFLGMSWSNTSLNTIYTVTVDGAAPSTNLFGGNSQALTWGAGEDKWIQIKRTSATNLEIKVYSDSAFSTQLGTVSETISGTTGLRYIKFMNHISSGSTNAVGTIDDVEFYNDTVAPATWTLQLSLENLKAYWKMGESSGNLINHATSIGSKTAMSADLVSSGTVNRGTAGHVSGVDSIGFPTYDADGNKVTANNSASDYGFMNKAAAKFTACWWAKNESYNNTVDLWGFGGNGNGTDIQFRNMASGFTIWFSGTEYTSFTQNVGDNNWHFYMLSWDEDGGSNNAQFQLDGTKQTATITTSNTSDATSPLTIGDVSGNEPEMDIQEFSLWNRILSDTEIAHIYNAGVGRQL